MATLTVSIDRTSLSLGPLVFSAADDASTWGIVRYVEPAMQPRIQYADAPFVHGSVAVASTWQQSIMGIDLAPDVASETALQAAVNEVKAALGQFSYAATVTTDAGPEVWRCDMGSIQPPSDGRTYEDLRDFDPVYSLTIPVYPVSAPDASH